eukprot:1337654-Amorphochlora_amoeboformis.AAC.1
MSASKPLKVYFGTGGCVTLCTCRIERMSVDPTARSLQALALSRLIDKIVEDAKKEEGVAL